MQVPQTLHLTHAPVRRARFWRRRSRSGPAAHIGVSGELDIATMPLLDRALRRARASADVVVLDLRALEFLDSSGAQFILETSRRLRAIGGRLIVVRGPAEVDWLLTLLGLDVELELVDTPPRTTTGHPLAHGAA